MDIHGLDLLLLKWINHHLVPNSIPVLQFISGYTTVISIGLTLLVLILSLVKRSKAMRRQFLILAAVLVSVAAVSQGLKQLLTRDRPFENHSFIEKMSDGGGYSFPSGHTMETFALAMALSLWYSKPKVIIPVYAWAVLVAYSRMALGVHYPSDILAGIVIGTFIGRVVPWIFNRFNSGRKINKDNHHPA